MLHKMMLGLVALGAIAFTAMPTDLSARGGHGHGGWHGSGGYRGYSGYGYRGYYGGYGYRGFYGPAYYGGYYGYPYAYGAYGCYRTVRVATPIGWRWQRMWVCG